VSQHPRAEKREAPLACRAHESGYTAGIMKKTSAILLSVMLLAGVGCRSVYYSTMEKFGVHKRDLLKKSVVAARDEQQEASEQFKDALTRLKELYGFKGGNLEKVYSQLNADHERSAAKAADVRERISKVETVANDLFREWETEIKQISTPSLRSSSQQQLADTRARYKELHTALKRAEASMEPVLVKFRDHVLYLKHNLNAQAIASLRTEAVSIQGDIANLIDEMNKSIRQADEFIKELP
jgi:hypothetical protein